MALSGIQLRDSLHLAGFPVDGRASDLENLASLFQAVNDKQKKHYEIGWNESLNKLRNLIEETQDPAAILAQLDAPPDSDGLVSSFLRNHDFDVPIDPALFQSIPGHIVTVRDGQYQQILCENAQDHRVTKILADLVKPETHTIVELGSGWGRNLCGLSLRLDRDDIRLVGAEQSLSGRDCAERLLALVPNKSVASERFDFYRPNFGFLKRLSRNGGEGMLIFSRAALEQAAFLGTDFVRSIQKAAPGATLVFIEPFGWQSVQELVVRTIRELISAVVSGAGKTILEHRGFTLSDTEMNNNAALWSVVSCYNMNLYSLIRDAEQQDLATIQRLDFNITADNPLIPYSLAVMKLKAGV